MTPDNFLALEPAIVARLRATLPPEVHVLTAADLDAVAGAEQPTPAVHVLFWDYGVALGKIPALAVVTQSWLTIVVDRNVADIEQGSHARQSAGPLAVQVLASLHRQTLKDADDQPLHAGWLTPADPPVKSGYKDGKFYLPLAWDVPINFVFENCPA